MQSKELVKLVKGSMIKASQGVVCMYVCMYVCVRVLRLALTVSSTGLVLEKGPKAKAIVMVIGNKYYPVLCCSQPPHLVATSFCRQTQ